MTIFAIEMREGEIRTRNERAPAQRQITDLLIVGSFGEMPMTGRKEVVDRG